MNRIMQMVLWCSLILLTACQKQYRDADNSLAETSFAQLGERPNILWLVVEDLGAYILAFGDSTTHTLI